MNERWTRRLCHAWLFLLPVSGACAVGTLSDRIVIDAGTQVTPDFLTTRSIANRGGLKLQPGDVLTYTRWSPGFASPGGDSKRHRYEPVTEIYRIPVREVDEEKGLLSAEEERLLAAVLTVQRLDWSDTAYDTANRSRTQFFSDLQNVLFLHRAKLWNALVGTLVIQRIGDPASGMSVVPVLQVETLCNALASDPAALNTFARAFINFKENADCNAGGPLLPRELTFMVQANLKTLLHAAATFDDANRDSRDEYFTNRSPSAQFNFASLERNGVRVARRDVLEADWTLREWEAANICRYGPKSSEAFVRRIRLVGGRRKLWISRGSEARPATYKVKTVLTEKESSRSISRISNGSFLEERAILNESALDELRMSDVDFIEWGRKDRPLLRRDSQVRAKPDGCYFPGTL